MGIARSVAVEKGVLKAEKVTQGWWRRFCERQPDISLHRGDPTAHIRMDAINSDTLRQYFTLLNDVLTKHDLHSKPAQIYNVDKSGIPFDPWAQQCCSHKRNQEGSLLIIREEGAGYCCGMCQRCRACNTTHGDI